MYKQSAYVIALFLGTSQAFIETPESNSLFATGMNGDEDLGQDITMKGQKFHYNQQSTNGCGNAELATADGNCVFSAAQVSEEPAAAEPVKEAEKVEVLEPEKVHILDPKIAKSHTTFYNRENYIQLEGEGEGEAEDEAKPKKAGKSKNGYPRPEQVHTLDPFVYTNISNMKGHVLNPSSGVRTAFYDKQNGLWRQDSIADMQLLQNEETPAIHPYNYDPWVYHFSRQNMRPYSGHINENPEDSRPRTEEEIAALPENVARAKKAAAKEAVLQAEKKAMEDKLNPPVDGTVDPAAKAAAEAADDKKLVDAALKAADKAAAAPAPKAALAEMEAFYNNEAGLWMYDTTLIQGDEVVDDVAEYGPTEKVASLNPIAYQYWSDTNKTGAFRRARTAFYSQVASENI